MKKYISFSGGTESTTMCLLYAHEADGIFADTGYEHDVLMARIRKVENYVRENIRKDFKIVIVKNKKYGSLKEYIVKSKFYPSFKARYCTRIFKIEPIDDYLEKYKDKGVALYIGLNYDERESRTGNFGNKKFVSYEYPLVNDKITRQECERILEEKDLLPNFPPYMQRGGCVGCYFKTKREYLAMAHLNPKEFAIVEKIENDIQDQRKEFYTILQNISMKEIREEAETSLFTPDEMYTKTQHANKCGVFCSL